ncbi:zinc-ribbon and DUF3426 domain-containing protein [Candidatus Methylopumilus turicensis]|uniref:Zinc finger/thioredoxin putative domain-containing protein n=1 Tax=Candidatus Methylopumilus turicensis TaxID=1581680 RepID=A0A0B7IRU9_9PROT|nr:zinc-ribbon and DUF3426 domain-containing protein [Candidatus Methylopumilus turicensis]CEN55069.1 conserved protein of unknown function [Candidatus Methylopumilus turicensis]
MSLVTKCPSCLTRFIIKPEQLESHEGQVRCGQCQHIFIADDYISATAEPEEFLRAKKKAALISKPIVFVILGLSILLAIFQSLYFLRTEIAKQWPAFKPALKSSCEYLGCSIPLPQHAELIVIDDAELIRDMTHEGLIKFNCLIVNNAPFIQSFPSIELTLTDKHDVALLRRKISPIEYLSGLEKRPDDGFAGNDEIQVRLNLKTADLPVAGFRAFIVY